MFTITREGEFDCTLKPGTPHCGIKEPYNKFRYEVSCTVDDEALDHEGFVLDNALLHKYWEDAYSQTPTGLSCENMAREAARHFFRALKKASGKECCQVSVRIWGIPSSSIKYTFTREDWAKKVGMLAA